MRKKIHLISDPVSGKIPAPTGANKAQITQLMGDQALNLAGICWLCLGKLSILCGKPRHPNGEKCCSNLGFIFPVFIGKATQGLAGSILRAHFLLVYEQ